MIPVRVPPLRERQEDIPVLSRHFLEGYCKELDKNIKKISGEAMELLLKYNYPGNVRELENIIERAVALENTDIILPESLPEYVRGMPLNASIDANKSEVISQELGIDSLNLEKAVADFEKTMILKAINTAGGVQKKAAEILNISPRSLRYLLQKYRIE